MTKPTSPFFSLFLASILAVTCFATTPAYAQDADCDGDPDASDNCVDKFNPTQEDIDGDLIGDRCDDDKDGDTVLDDADNCPRDANTVQDDTDADGVGDACDQCSDAPPGGAINRRGCTIDQLCPCDGPEPDESWKNHADYFRCVKKKAKNFAKHDLITKEERRAIVIDAKANACGNPEPAPGDNDGDGVLDGDDNCVSDSNPSQLNSDGDALGNACDTDKDDDGVLNVDDNCPIVANGAGQGDDADGDGVGDACDACSGTGLDDPVDRNGCSIDQACPCEQDEDGNPWKNHGKYVRCVVDEVFRFKLRDILTAEEADGIKSSAATSDCGDRPPVCE
jgi:hypothetical protein